MPPTLALIVWLILLLALLIFDPAKVRGTSPALWIPVIWMFFAASRLASQWLGINVGDVSQAVENGNWLDRTVALILMVSALAVLLSRRFKWNDFVGRNVALLAFVGFGLVSVLWSDFPYAAFRKWFRDFGGYVVVLVALSDVRPIEAIRTVLRRLFYILIPLCILLDKYFLGLSRQYDTWTGRVMNLGATTSKNMLGALCLVSGVFFFWDIVTRWSDRKQSRIKRILLVDTTFLAMTLWVLKTANSATSQVCLLIGCFAIWAVQSKMFRKHPAFLKVLAPSAFIVFLALVFGLGLGGKLAAMVGRDPTFTDRTEIWHVVLSMKTNPVIGTGYENFWLGPRLREVSQLLGSSINEAHNGYIQVYLNLGWIGVGLLITFLFASYRRICQMLTLEHLCDHELLSLSMALWTISLYYNMTEAAFGNSLLWLVFLLVVIRVSKPLTADGRITTAAKSGELTRHAPALRSEPAWCNQHISPTGLK